MGTLHNYNSDQGLQQGDQLNQNMPRPIITGNGLSCYWATTISDQDLKMAARLGHEKAKEFLRERRIDG